ncbi:MAG: hypothetical protein WBR33_07355 [Pseudonocardiaceae bacterium]
MLREPGPGLRGQRQPARYRRRSCFHPPCPRQILPPNPGVGAVGADEDITGGGAAVGEVRRDPAVVADRVALEGGAETDDVGKAGQ